MRAKPTLDEMVEHYANKLNELYNSRGHTGRRTCPSLIAYMILVQSGHRSLIKVVDHIEFSDKTGACRNGVYNWIRDYKGVLTLPTRKRPTMVSQGWLLRHSYRLWIHGRHSWIYCWYQKLAEIDGTIAAVAEMVNSRLRELYNEDDVCDDIPF